MKHLWVAFSLSVALCISPAVAFAFHSDSSWSEAALDGGAGNVYFLGLPEERGWDCTLCHVEAPGRVRAKVTASPPEFLTEGTVPAGTLQKIIIELDGESVGARANVNTMNFALIDGAGGLAARTVRSAKAFAGELFEPMMGADNLPYRFSAGKLENVTRWEIEFDAPCEGEADFYFGIVDGDGARDTTNKNQDPFGDDVVMGKRHFKVVGPACPTMAASSPAPPTPTVVRHASIDMQGFFGLGAAGVAIVLARMLRSRLR